MDYDIEYQEKKLKALGLERNKLALFCNTHNNLEIVKICSYIVFTKEGDEIGIYRKGAVEFVGLESIFSLEWVLKKLCKTCGSIEEKDICADCSLSEGSCSVCGELTLVMFVNDKTYCPRCNKDNGESIEIPVTEDEKKLIEMAAKLRNMSISDFVIWAVELHLDEKNT
jgi:hypothetical protein